MSAPKLSFDRSIPFVDAVWRVIEGKAHLDEAIDVLTRLNGRMNSSSSAIPLHQDPEGFQRLRRAYEVLTRAPTRCP